MELDRRHFLKGAFATGAVAAAGVALAGCSPSESGEKTRVGHYRRRYSVPRGIAGF